jgi:hypothetical protein
MAMLPGEKRRRICSHTFRKERDEPARLDP